MSTRIVNPIVVHRSRQAVASPRQSLPPAAFEDQTRSLNARLFWAVAIVVLGMVALSAWFAVGWIGAEIEIARMEGKVEAQEAYIQKLEAEGSTSKGGAASLPPIVIHVVVAVFIAAAVATINPALSALVLILGLAMVGQINGIVDLVQ